MTYVHVQMLDQLNSGKFRDALPDRMSTVYKGLLDNHASSIRRVMESIKGLLDNHASSIRRVMESIDAFGQDGCTLFHCRAGKDRTGVVAMLLLGLAGVSDEDIVADYAATQRYLGRGLRAQRVAVSALLCRRAPRCLFEAIPAEMELTLEHLHERYGTVREYLEGHAGLAGVSDEDIVADYAATQRYLGRGLRAQRVAVSALLCRRAPRCLFEASPAEIELTLEHLHERYGTVREYLEGHAEVPVAVLDRIAHRLRFG